MNIKYKLKRFRVKLRGLGKKKLELDEVQQKAYNITIKMINDKDSNLNCDTLGRRTVENGENYMSMTKNHIFIINNSIYYNIFVDDITIDIIREKFDAKIVRKIDIREKMALSKLKKNLDIIFNEISDS
jgi:hypothetical protein